MAITTGSPDWSLVCINWNRRNQRPTIYYTCSTLPFLSFLCLSSRALAAKSLACSSPVLEEASTSTSSQVVNLDLKLQGLQPPSIPDTKDLNRFICELFKDPQTEELAYHYYEKAKATPDFRADKSALKFLIRYLIRSKNWSSILSLPDDFRAFQVLPDSSTCCKLIGSCIRARKFKLVNNFLEVVIADEGVAVLAFDSAMRGYNKLHMYSSTVVIYQRMKSAEIGLDSGCFCRIMEAYLKLGNYEKVVSIFQEFDSQKVAYSPFHTQIYWILCESLGKLRRPFEALEFFRELSSKGITEDHTFYSSLISSFATVRDIKIAEELLEEAENKNMLRDPALFFKLVLMYTEEGLMEKTISVVAVMNRVKIRVSDCIYCAIVNGFSKRRGLRAAVKVYEDLLLQGCEPGQVTYASVLNIYCRLGLYSKAESIFSEMEQKGFYKCVVAYSSLIAMYGKTGRPRDAMRLVAKMKERGCEPNVWIYNSLLDMHGKALHLRQVEKIWKEMRRRKIVPDRVSYTSVISAYCRAKELEECLKYYQEFRLNGGTIDRAMAGIMVAIYSKMNLVDELVKLLQEMKAGGTKLDARLYRSVMNALRDAGLQMQVNWLQENFEAT